MSNTAVKNGEVIHTPTSHSKNLTWKFFLPLLLLVFFIAGCGKEDSLLKETNALKQQNGPIVSGTLALPSTFEVTNLVADTESYNPKIIDPNLVNAWGIAIGPTGAFWISAAYTELSVIYDDEGNTLRAPVTMDGEPTGQVYNFTHDFAIPGVGPSRFIFVTEDGKIIAWGGGNVVTTVVDDSGEGAAYTGVELALDGTEPFLYVTNVAEGTIDVYDKNWVEVDNKPFTDPALPMGMSPFNIRTIAGQLFVTYVGPNETDGLVNVFRTDGSFVRRFATGAPLNAPWGMTLSSPDFGFGRAVLIGNFADGRINVYAMNGQYLGQMGDSNGAPIEIEGLWALTFTYGPSVGFGSELYFTAGPDEETHGVFGEIELAE